MTRRRDFDALSEAQIAAGRTQKRWVAPKAAFRPAGGPQAVADLLDTIQHVAEAATGERSFLHLHPKATGTRGR
ncbi:hypothetical protein SAMN05216360_110194 [Methylobacterium phyllostachyos]|uniref:Uncharacterized protein n=1 Tax=Methylobacterium phyllostachyos TaxID=582672 RepID=A0A1H0DJL1_9HYPH|nr:hypothetical protein [Methylobacterium phyllostachyos]SDN70355.1 hypothetical protein SAMN05216360_110194 [Methylobacterium phyllostachyos]